MEDGVEADQQINHERVRRELWAAIYRQEHEQSATRVKPAFRYVEAADYALEQFDKRFAAAPSGPAMQATQSDADGGGR